MSTTPDLIDLSEYVEEEYEAIVYVPAGLSASDLRALVDAAAPAPWGYFSLPERGANIQAVAWPALDDIAMIDAFDDSPANGQMIAALRNNADMLIAALERLADREAQIAQVLRLLRESERRENEVCSCVDGRRGRVRSKPRCGILPLSEKCLFCRLRAVLGTAWRPQRRRRKKRANKP